MDSAPFNDSEKILARNIRVDAILDCLEQALRDGQEPCIEEYLKTESRLTQEKVRSEWKEVQSEWQRGQVQSLGLIDGGSLSKRSVDTSTTRPASVGRYEVVEELGQGAFGVVYRGFDPVLQRSVAIKVPSQRITVPLAREALLREAQSVSNLRDANIVTLHDCGLEGPLCYLVYEYIEGDSLTEWAKASRITFLQIAKVVAKVAGALQRIHERGIYHRDIKPANILVSKTGKPYIIDLGLAAWEEELFKEQGRVAGTPAYMAPEQFVANAHFDGRTDIYSLGVVLYQLLCGRPPFAGSKENLRKQIFNRPPPPPRQVKGTIPRALEEICLTALQKKMEDRYPAAEDMAQALRDWVKSKAVKTTKQEMESHTLEDVYQIVARLPVAQEPQNSEIDRQLLPGLLGPLSDLESLLGRITDTEFLAKLAVYSRTVGFPGVVSATVLLTLLNRERVDAGLFQRTFHRVVDDGKQLREVFNVLRSGSAGKRGFSRQIKQAFAKWLNNAPVEKLLVLSMAKQPSFRDIMRLVHPSKSSARFALFGWLMGDRKSVDDALLPPIVRALNAYNSSRTDEAKIASLDGYTYPWELLTGSSLTERLWQTIAMHMTARELPSHLNALHRHQVFANSDLTAKIADRIDDPLEVRHARCLPYHYFTAYFNLHDGVPDRIRRALARAAEAACANLPELPGPLLIGLDVSQAMKDPVDVDRGGQRPGRMRCLNAAACCAAALARQNSKTVIIPFDEQAYSADMLNPKDSILEQASYLATFGGRRSASCDLPFAAACQNYSGRRFDGCVIVSTRGTWPALSERSHPIHGQWAAFKRSRPASNRPKLVCIDLLPQADRPKTSQADIRVIGGFSDVLFRLVASFLGDRSEIDLVHAQEF